MRHKEEPINQGGMIRPLESYAVASLLVGGGRAAASMGRK